MPMIRRAESPHGAARAADASDGVRAEGRFFGRRD
ncbi:hypothetical protein M218_32595 [Burkholderia pseudomallei MSHR338]|nr:hypothetical protein BPC006_II1007 [Burkholderia pseudomallei BPC006]EMP75570.1 hypothetical protein D512_19777 [Burkholderia pseudomallei MSHR1043]EQA84926.1 hypothetical protein M218_32595 [Burkholderia pseudomallei MSHR338]VUD57879.1 unnamed protein product [Burkholderia pseudomallei]VUD60026.1 unnamed protein product [Burkholderia pseudomallei]